MRAKRPRAERLDQVTSAETPKEVVAMSESNEPIVKEQEIGVATPEPGRLRRLLEERARKEQLEKEGANRSLGSSKEEVLPQS
jgi:hypothetical protein